MIERSNDPYRLIVRGGLILVAFGLVLGMGMLFGWIIRDLGSDDAPPDFEATLMAMTAQAPTATVSGTDTPTNTPEPTATTTPTATATATATATYTPSLTPTATATPLPPDWVQLVADITIPDGTILVGGETFTKIWRLRNAGSRTWTADYDLVFISGERMSGAAAVGLPRAVFPGETVDISVRLTAPAAAGTYRGRWMLRNASGGVFGVGAATNVPFWVEIRVEDPARIVYDFAAHYCEATWTSGAGVLPCPGAEGDIGGIIAGKDAPVMEGGITMPGPSLAVAPHIAGQGWITGAFPAFTVASGDRFRATVACMDNSTKCYMQFRLDYRIADGRPTLFANWWEAYDGLGRHIDIDLSSLRGSNVIFLLSVAGGETPVWDNGLWIRPRIVR